ncbi:MAG: MerR family transcriptional regulator [Candidatus Marinimicrobia bacterium]|jgi:DNA-binding transcriptional MerR regulator|nr:MerR family transcriptional regulator [Candidatus Neomarinimicrobiota bacterium]HOD37488.1 MerR family transcriptional regulator [Candidatus Neomarinimicrobiota bacterium]HPD26128.1 MerR family transcriptional regulator [Candidatus Neomarinimicrobiota bacterium]HQM35527.1 MerR family transcriptional regulator [Candidatus Neomarinimicrobiota bacterium]
MEKPIKKLYYSIGEVSEITGLKQYVLRYWEKEFPSLTPTKNRAGNRAYREKDIQLIQYIKHLLYDKRFTIEGAKQKLKEMKPEDWQKAIETENRNEIDGAVVERTETAVVLSEIKKGLNELLEMLNNW